jgi:hypothetical protein
VIVPSPSLSNREKASLNSAIWAKQGGERTEAGKRREWGGAPLARYGDDGPRPRAARRLGTGRGRAADAPAPRQPRPRPCRVRGRATPGRQRAAAAARPHSRRCRATRPPRRRAHDPQYSADVPGPPSASRPS